MAMNAAPQTSLIRDVFRPVPGAVKLRGYWDEKIRLGVEHQLKKLDYTKLVDFFRLRPTPFASGEFWGKTVRAACWSYQYRPDRELKRILDRTVDDLLSTQTPDGCISACSYENQPKGSDLWERKYVLLGLQHYYAIAPRPEVLRAMTRLADYTLEQIGPPPKTRIVDTGWAFAGIESSSILEPMMNLHRLTGDPRYLDFARYIVEEEGACKRGNLFEAAFAGVAPRDINGNGRPEESIAKAYEEMSCFEGLLEYYRATGDEHWKEAALTFYGNVRDQEITLLGSGGGDRPYNLGPGTGEQWNHLACEQTNPDMSLMMETCVTVTWMKFCDQVLRLTGDSRVADEIEKSLYNALAGAQKFTGDYYDYFQPFRGRRGGKVNFFSDIGGFPLSCCTANGPMGMALVPLFAVMASDTGPVVNLYAPGTAELTTPGGSALRLEMETSYPKTGAVEIRVTCPASEESFGIALRIPAWSRRTVLSVNGEAQPVTPGTYATVTRAWKTGDRIEMLLDLRCRLVPAPEGVNPAGRNFQALVYGPLVLSRDRRLGGDVYEVTRIRADAEGFVATTPLASEFGEVAFQVPTCNGKTIAVMDYASAGNTWDEGSELVTWIPTA
jgi:DUF1680 family protein